MTAPDEPLRQTASDRPGVAQPVPVRDIPAKPWGPILLFAFALFAVLMVAWEWHWRAYGVDTGYYRNTEGLWAIQRRRIDQGEGDATVVVGASRMLFDVQLSVWERLAGKRPIQLALEGTSPMTPLEGLADDPKFTGTVLVGVAPDVFFSEFEYRGSVFKAAKDETPAQRAGQWLSMHLYEPHVAYYDEDFALRKLLKEEVPWPDRPGRKAGMDVRKLMETGIDRDTHMWHRLEEDAAYREHARAVWAQDFDTPPEAEDIAYLKKALASVLKRAEAAVKKLRARGVTVIFVRAPSTGRYYEFEQRAFPRKDTWDVLLARTGAPGIHFEDHPEMQGLELPEWSHLARKDAERFTEALWRAVEQTRREPQPAAPVGS
jgi:hypothetical protein